MKESLRDTQFAGFAKMLHDELIALNDHVYGSLNEYAEAKKLLIARRAYDLVEHTVGYGLEYLHECGIELSGGMGKRIVPSIPDMTEWPEEEV